MHITQHNNGTLEINIPTEKGEKTITTTQNDYNKIAKSLAQSLDNELEMNTSIGWHYSPQIASEPLDNGDEIITYRIVDDQKEETTYSIEPLDDDKETQWDLHLSEETTHEFISHATN